MYAPMCSYMLSYNFYDTTLSTELQQKHEAAVCLNDCNDICCTNLFTNLYAVPTFLPMFIFSIFNLICFIFSFSCSFSSTFSFVGPSSSSSSSLKLYIEAPLKSETWTVLILTNAPALIQAPCLFSE